MPHLSNMSDEQIVKALMPILLHPNYEYFIEYLRREQMKQVTVGMNAKEPVDIFRAQGQSSAYANLQVLKSRLEASK